MTAVQPLTMHDAGGRLAELLEVVTDDQVSAADAWARLEEAAGLIDQLLAAIDTWARTGGMHVRASSRTRVEAQARLHEVEAHVRSARARLTEPPTSPTSKEDTHAQP